MGTSMLLNGMVDNPNEYLMVEKSGQELRLMKWEMLAQAKIV